MVCMESPVFGHHFLDLVGNNLALNSYPMLNEYVFEIPLQEKGKSVICTLLRIAKQEKIELYMVLNLI